MLKAKIKSFLYYFGWRKIPEDEIVYLGFSTLDPLGRVFEYKSNVYRGIYPDKVEYVINLFNSGLYGALNKSGLFIGVEFTNYWTENFPLVLKMEKVTKTLPTEWTYTMLKQAAITILKVNKICERYDYQLSDAHPYNILFNNNKPIWVDLGSIVPKNKVWQAKTEFVNFTILPLYFFSQKQLLEAYSVLQSERTFKIASKNFRDTIFWELFIQFFSKKTRIDIDKYVSEKWIINTFKFNEVLNDSYWSDYQAEEKDLIKDVKMHKNNRFKRFFRISKLIDIYCPDANTALDLAGNTGLASLIISKNNAHITKIINTDYDYNSIEKSIRFLMRHSRFNVESYLLNFMLPMHEKTVFNFKSDLVLALAITHHLLLTQNHKITEILEKIKQYSNKYVFIEFMPLGLWGGDPKNKPPVPVWYTTHWFKKEFKKYFTLLHSETLEYHVINGISEPHRVLFIGKVKD